MINENLIQVTGLSRRFGAFHAVKDLDFSLQRGEVLGLLGPNGAGKSTTLKMLCGALAPSSGQVLIGGADLAAEPREAKRQLGYLPEIPPLYPDLTTDEYLTFCARIRRVPHIVAAVQQVKSRCALDDAGERLIRNLSKGYQQRVGIAQAILHRPEVVVLDEPTVGLDPIQIREIRQLIKRIGEEHSVILSTHILPEASSVCDRVLILNRGRIVLDAPTTQFSEQANQVILGLRQAPKLEVLGDALQASLRDTPPNAALTSIEVVGPARYRLSFSQQMPPLENLASLAAASHWGLCELSPLAPSLEEVFISLTCTEGEAASAHSGNSMRVTERLDLAARADS